jgi:transcriptional regulator with XRE-family HTH domain
MHFQNVKPLSYLCYKYADNMTTFGTRLANAMKEGNLTQRQLHDITGIDTHTISDFLTDKRQPRLDQIEKFAQALNVSFVELLPHYLISGNTYHDNSGNVNNYLIDKNALVDLAKENARKEIKIEQLTSEILSLRAELTHLAKQKA